VYETAENRSEQGKYPTENFSELLFESGARDNGLKHLVERSVDRERERERERERASSDDKRA